MQTTNKTLYLILITTILMMFIGCSNQVEHVIDGDTIILENNKTVRLYGIDAPEKSQKYGDKSTEFLKSLISDKEIKLKHKGTGEYERIIGIIKFQGKNINRLMIKNGWAWVYDKYCNKSEWLILENKAKTNNLGLWKQNNPTSPWNFRHDN